MAPRRAIIIIDVQEDYFAGPLAIQYPDPLTSEKNIASILDAAEAKNLPIVAVQHQLPEGAPIFASGSPGFNNREVINSRAAEHWATSTKSVASALADEKLLAWLRENDVSTITLVGFMTNNCVLASAAHAELLGFSVEVISDATGAIHMANSAGQASAEQVHNTLMVLLNSNFAAVGTTEQWLAALHTESELAGSDLINTAIDGAKTFGES